MTSILIYRNYEQKKEDKEAKIKEEIKQELKEEEQKNKEEQAKKEDEWFYKIYQNFKEAFEIAGNKNGVVIFC